MNSIVSSRGEKTNHASCEGGARAIRDLSLRLSIGRAARRVISGLGCHGKSGEGVISRGDWSSNGSDGGGVYERAGPSVSPVLGLMNDQYGPVPKGVE